MKRLPLIIADAFRCALGLGLALALLWLMQGLLAITAAQGALTAIPPTLDRPHAPVVLAGSVLSNLVGSPIDDIFVYAHQGTALSQIPFQIDERGPDGTYVVAEDGQLDANDELVFMGGDGGGWIDVPTLWVDDEYIRPTYVITVSDPISNTYAWAYVFRSAALSRTLTEDYVSYDAGSDRIASPGRYALGFDATYGFPDYLTLGNSDVDVLDRAKVRITGTVHAYTFSLDEENISLDGVYALDGPVRVVRVSASTLTTGLVSPIQTTATFFLYRSLFVQPAIIPVPGAPAQAAHLRISMDWNELASGMIYYDANNPTGATIDGSPDTIAVSPPTKWTQISGITGTVVSVSEMPAALGGTQSTYYRDDSTVDGDDTGDQRSYGDAGFQVEQPIPGLYELVAQTYFAPGTIANVGATYLADYDHPLQASVGPARSTWRIHLPVVMRK